MRSSASRVVAAGAWGLFAAVMLQAVLGILTLLNQVPIDLALAHQGTAIVVLTLAMVQMERLSPRKIELAPEELAASPAR
jgi:cytochrome c oxidase assembly protein subunit 15